MKQHLLSFGYNRLKQTGDTGARKKTNNKWFETQDSINYSEDFDRQKIVWGEISDRTKFCVDLKGEFVAEATTFIMTGDFLLYLLAFLNSKFSGYIFSKIGTTTGVGTVRWKKFTIEQLRIPTEPKSGTKAYEKLVLEIIDKINSDQDYFLLTQEIDKLVYDDFGLSVQEIQFIDSQ